MALRISAAAAAVDNPAPTVGRWAASGPGLVAVSPKMVELIAKARRAAESDAKVLITGETGVGKDVVATFIHERSRRAGRPFVPINCAGLTESILESELFGHVKGSFTGAFRDKRGRLHVAHGGTVFLDEIGEMSLRMQALLLRFLETGEIQPVGSDVPAARVDVRVIAATNRNLPEMITTGHFRDDLLFRLRVIHLAVPPLRERPEDIRAFVHSWLKREQCGFVVSDAARQVLERYSWPGNIRELQNALEQAVALAKGPELTVADLPQTVQNGAQLLTRVRERRTQVADQLFQALVTSGYSFFAHIYPLFLARDITRHDLRELVRRGLTTTRGNYRALVSLFGIAPRDYKRFLNVLAAHDCAVDFRPFRNGVPDPPERPLPVLLPRLDPSVARAADASAPDSSRDRPSGHTWSSLATPD